MEMDMQGQNPTSTETEGGDESEIESYGLRFHLAPFLIALGLTLVLYLLVFFAVDEYPTYIDPSDLPPPPAAG